jgi:hypothetical protein
MAGVLCGLGGDGDTGQAAQSARRLSGLATFLRVLPYLIAAVLA